MEARAMKYYSSPPLFNLRCFFYLFCLLSLSSSRATGAISAPIYRSVLPPPPSSPPDQNSKNASIDARWLIARNSWGVLSTISNGLGGAPYGNVAIFTDGYPGIGLGIPYFYLETLEPVGNDAINGSLAALTVSEAQLGACAEAVQNPTCRRVTLTGKLKSISLEDPDLKFAQIALPDRHPEIEHWPGNFQIYKLDVKNIFLVNDFGKPKEITLKDYLEVPPML